MTLNKQKRLRINAWCKKFFQVVNNVEWRKNRNLHAICLLDMVLNNRYEEPYNKFPADGPLPLLSKPIVISKLSKKFWLFSQYLRNEEILSNGPSLEGNENNLNNNYNNFEEKKYEEQIPQNNIGYMKMKKDIKIRPKSSGVYGRKSGNKRTNNRKDMKEINQLNDIILTLQSELNKQDFIINNQINEKKELAKRIHQLEQVLNNFC